MTLKAQEKKAKIAVDKFNAIYTPGITMNLRDDAGNLHQVTLMSQARVISCTAVAEANKGFGTYLLERFIPTRYKK